MSKVVLVAAVALIDSDGRVLIAQRPANKSLAGLWEFPGGKIIDSETPEEGLVRELREELGVDTEKSCLAPVGFFSGKMEEERESLEDVHLLMLLFVCRKWQNMPVGLEGQSIKWVKAEELLSYNMPLADRPLAAQLREILW